MLETMFTKADLRRHVRERLRAVAADELGLWSRQLVARLQARTDLWATPGTVALFGGLRNEPDLISDFIPWLRRSGWRTALFRVDGVELQPYEITGPQDLQRGPLGVWEPLADERRILSPADLTVILVPGLAFSSRDGTRLGRGGGFYDRFLAQPLVTAARVGVCFEAQVYTELPHEAHDAHVQSLVTEKGDYRW